MTFPFMPIAVLQGRGTEALAHSVGTIAVFTMVILVCWFGSRTARTRIEAQSEIRKKLIDKFGSAQELSAFLESKGGQELLRGVGNRRGGRHRGLGAGIILTVLGLALIGLAAAHRMDIVAGAIVLAVGLAFLILTAISHKLGKKTGDDCPACGGPMLP